MNENRPDLKLLECLEALMTERSVSRAAASLNLSQPAMSHALGRLRRLFDDPLLLKGRGGMTPTKRAMELQGPIRDLLVSAERLTRKPAAFLPATARVRFALMAAEHVEYLLAPRLTLHLQREAPGIDVEFRYAERDQALRRLERGEIDLRLGWWPQPAPTLRHKILYRDRLVCVARRGHPAIDDNLTRDQFVQTPHVRILTLRGPSHRAIDEAISALHHKLRIAVRIQSAFDMANVVANTNFIATAPERQARMLAEKLPLQILRLPISVPDMRIAMYWHERTHKQPSHRWFRECVAEIAKRL